MPKTNLISSTKSPAVDRAIVKAIAAVREKVSNPLCASYLSGSYANGYAVPTSDIDLYLIFHRPVDEETKKQIDALEAELGAVEPVLDLIPWGKLALKEAGLVEMGRFYKHVWGEAVHDEVPNPPWDDYLYKSMHGAFKRMDWTRKSKPFRWPLDFPDPIGKYRGYDWRKTTVNGEDVPSLKEIVVMTGWMATGLVAWKGRVYVPSKQECPSLFYEHVGGAAAENFAQITEFFRRKLHYLMPVTEEDQARAQELLPAVLQVENYFLEQYQDYLFEGLNEKDPEKVRHNLIRLRQVLYANGRSLAAVEAYVPQNDRQAEEQEKTLVVLRNPEAPGSDLKLAQADPPSPTQ